MKNFTKWMVTAISVLNSMNAAAIDFSLLGTDVSISGFATAGGAISDRSYNYDKTISSDGTITRDSLFGLQLDAKLTDEFSVTAQGKFSPKDKEANWEPSLVWAFLSWRPANDWLFRAGQLRSPFYLFSETLDVGVTYDFARLPIEMYSLSPHSEYIGGSFSKNWNIDWGELTLDGYIGTVDTNIRHYQRDNVQLPGPFSPGSNYIPLTMDEFGVVATLVHEEDRYRAGFYHTDASINGGKAMPISPSLEPASYFVPPALAPALTGSAYAILPNNTTKKLTALIFAIGAEYKLPEDFRLLGEINHRSIDGADVGADSTGGYISLLKEIDDWTPYVSFAMLKSKSGILDLYKEINYTPGVSAKPFAASIPAVKEGVKKINASQRVISEGLSAFDQHTIAIGSSYRITPTQKLKLEWARTHIGVNSELVDAPSGGNVTNSDIDIFSLSYNFVF